MDTSKTSQNQQSQLTLGQRLRGITKTLRPYMKILPFSRLGDCLGVGKRVVDGLTYHFDVWDTRAPLSLSSDDMFFVIPIIENVYQGQKKRLKKYELVRLLFQRTNSYEQWGDWGFHKVEFSRQYPNNPGMESQYVSSVSEIVMCKDDGAYLDYQLGKLNLPVDFIKKVEEAIGKWIMETVEKRRVALETLEGLQENFPVGNFVLKYVLPNGNVAGYHLDMFCNIGRKDQAKVISHPDTPKAMIPIVSENFAHAWEIVGGREYRDHPRWEGTSFKDIRIVAEAV